MAVLPEQQDESLFSPADPPTRLCHLQQLGLKEKKKRKEKALVHAPVHRNVMNLGKRFITRVNKTVTAHASLYDAIKPSASYFLIFPIRFLAFQRKISFEIKQICKL